MSAPTSSTASSLVSPLARSTRSSRVTRPICLSTSPRKRKFTGRISPASSAPLTSSTNRSMWRSTTVVLQAEPRRARSARRSAEEHEGQQAQPSSAPGPQNTLAPGPMRSYPSARAPRGPRRRCRDRTPFIGPPVVYDCPPRRFPHGYRRPRPEVARGLLGSSSPLEGGLATALAAVHASGVGGQEEHLTPLGGAAAFDDGFRSRRSHRLGATVIVQSTVGGRVVHREPRLAVGLSTDTTDPVGRELGEDHQAQAIVSASCAESRPPHDVSSEAPGFSADSRSSRLVGSRPRQSGHVQPARCCQPPLRRDLVLRGLPAALFADPEVDAVVVVLASLVPSPRPAFSGLHLVPPIHSGVFTLDMRPPTLILPAAAKAKRGEAGCAISASFPLQIPASHQDWSGLLDLTRYRV